LYLFIGKGERRMHPNYITYSGVTPQLNLPTYPVTSITVPPFDRTIEISVSQLLEEHGCTIKKEEGAFTVTFPVGTWKKELFPRTACERYCITLPDGFQMLQDYEPMRDLNLLFLMGE
jgi:hypothetical protein